MVSSQSQLMAKLNRASHKHVRLGSVDYRWSRTHRRSFRQYSRQIRQQLKVSSSYRQKYLSSMKAAQSFQARIYFKNFVASEEMITML